MAHMKYDDASWHFDDEFPELPESAGATHIAMFLAWAALHGLASEVHTVDFANELSKLKSRAIVPGAWFLAVCDGKFTDEDLNEEGNRFAAAYYEAEEGAVSTYLSDYEETFPNLDTLYSVDDSWVSYDALTTVISRRFDAWRGR